MFGIEELAVQLEEPFHSSRFCDGILKPVLDYEIEQCRTKVSPMASETTSVSEE
jgi:hypothetical protein